MTKKRLQQKFNRSKAQSSGKYRRMKAKMKARIKVLDDRIAELEGQIRDLLTYGKIVRRFPRTIRRFPRSAGGTVSPG